MQEQKNLVERNIFNILIYPHTKNYGKGSTQVAGTGRPISEEKKFVTIAFHT